MDYRKELLAEHSKKRATKIANDAGKSPKNFANLVEVYLAGPYRVTQRASWPINLCVEKDPTLIYPHLSKLLRFLDRKDLHSAVKRNTVRFLQFIEIPKRLHGRVAELCFRFLEDNNEPIAVRVFSMTVLKNLAIEHPDLRRELVLIIQGKINLGSAAFRSRGSKILRQMAG